MWLVLSLFTYIYSSIHFTPHIYCALPTCTCLSPTSTIPNPTSTSPLTSLTMESAIREFHTFIAKTSHVSREDEIFNNFCKHVDVLATVMAHQSSFEALVNHMLRYVKPYAVNLDETEKKWVACNFLNHLFRNDKSFFKRMGRFIDNLSRLNYRVVDDDFLSTNDFPTQYGTYYISWKMCFILLL